MGPTILQEPANDDGDRQLEWFRPLQARALTGDSIGRLAAHRDFKPAWKPVTDQTKECGFWHRAIEIYQGFEPDTAKTVECGFWHRAIEVERGIEPVRSGLLIWSGDESIACGKVVGYR